MKPDSLTWRQLLPQLDLNDFEKCRLTPMALQEKARTALDLFLTAPSGAVLVLKADEQPAYAEMVESHLRAHLPQTLAPSGADYQIEQADSFSFPLVQVRSATSNEDNFAAKSAVEYALYYDAVRLFGHVLQHPASHDLALQPGLVHQVCNGVLILAVSPLLHNPSLWQRLKHIVLSGCFDWQSPNPHKPMNYHIPSYPLPLKLILLGDRETLAEFSLLEPSLYDFAQYAEIENYFLTDSTARQQQWVNNLLYYADQAGLATLSEAAITALYRQAVRESEDSLRQTVNPRQLNKWLSAVADISRRAGHKQIEADDVQNYFDNLAYQQSSLQEFSYNDILREQIYICSDGSAVGEINGLSVIEYAGTPVVYGEPSRITCTVQFGDGEITDVERKSELAGNIHGKGTLLAQYCLSNLLDLPAQLPFAASIAFEQSYADIDGDSASLAQFCVLVSALANVEIDLGIAVTGSIDQGGLVHAVGGVNVKIEGFYALCQARGLTGRQGVIIPTVCAENLSLRLEVVESVKNGRFHIWTVDNVEQALYLLTGKQLLPQNDNSRSQQSLAEMISQRIENKVETLVAHPLSKWLSWLKTIKKQ
ncbi:Lon protease family protein [Chelonobacter oris]|uniref:Lon protease family protein n=1 Tax=Chelonobacter oris TaxID=505317 RepID=UPI002447225B|nr:Lon protease family protein [Chelonobacter oris]